MQSCGFLCRGRIQKKSIRGNKSFPAITDTIHLLINEKPLQASQR